MEDVIRNILRTQTMIVTGADTLSADADLFDAGLTSYGSVTLMMSIEETIGVEFPDQLMTKQTFKSIRKLASAAESLAA